MTLVIFDEHHTEFVNLPFGCIEPCIDSLEIIPSSPSFSMASKI